MRQPDDLVRLAELIRLSAETARFFSDTNPEVGHISRITELSRQIEAAALELSEIGKNLEDPIKRSH